MAAAVGNDEPYNCNHVLWNIVQNNLSFSGSGLYNSIISKPAENTFGDVWIVIWKKKMIYWSIGFCVEPKSKFITDVKMRPFDWFFSTSVNADEISCSNAVFKLLTGARFISKVAIPVLSSTVRLTSLFNRDDVDEIDRTEIARKHCFTTKKLIIETKNQKKMENI